MKKQFILILFSVVIITTAASSQSLLAFKSDTSRPESENPGSKVPTFEFSSGSLDSEVNTIPAELAGDHPFGQIIAKKCYLLEKKYTYQVAITPGNPAVKTVIKKPVIYESVRRIEKDLKKSVRKDEISVSEATVSFEKILDVALSILNLDTKDFEKVLSSCESTRSKIELFTNTRIKSF
jgi:hypothetical protein